MKIEVFDPPMCCSTGVCGASVDPELVRFSADLDWLSRQGVLVERYNLSQQPAAFATNSAVKEALVKFGNPCLPLILADGVIVEAGKYPTRDALARHAGLDVSPSLFTDAVRELVAISASIATNCEMCFKYHYSQARKYGVSKEDIRLAVETAQAVKESPAKSIMELAEKYLSDGQGKPSTPCCGPDSSASGGRCC